MKYITFYWILTFTLPLLNRKENMVSTVFLEQELCIFLFRVIDEGLKGCITQQDSEIATSGRNTRDKNKKFPFLQLPAPPQPLPHRGPFSEGHVKHALQGNSKINIPTQPCTRIKKHKKTM
jgi:hypothetical protein